MYTNRGGRLKECFTVILNQGLGDRPGIKNQML